MRCGSGRSSRFTRGRNYSMPRERHAGSDVLLDGIALLRRTTARSPGAGLDCRRFDLGATVRARRLEARGNRGREAWPAPTGSTALMDALAAAGELVAAESKH